MAGALCMASLQASLAQCGVASQAPQQKQKSWGKAACFRVPARACSAPLRLQAFSGLHSSNPLQLRTDPGFESSSLGLGNGSKWFAMRHGRKVPKLGRPADQRRALLRGLTTELLRHGRIKTTHPRARAMRKYVDHMITLAKGGSLHQRRQALGFLYDKQLVHSIFAEVPGRYGERNGGYTRIIRTMPRRAALEVDCRALGGQRFRNVVKGGNFIVAKRGETRRDQKPKKYPRWDPSKKAQNSFKKLPKGDTFLREDDVFGTLQTASGEDIPLREDQAVGQVVAAQANIMRVIVVRGGSVEDDSSGTLLLCYVRALLKKIKKRVLVGDYVLISGIDWPSRRGMVEDVLNRKSEILDPPVANVDHLVVLFALDRPKLEPVALSRFLVEAESMDIPFTVVLNKADLVSEEVIQSWRERLLGWGYDPIFCSVSGNTGLSSLAEILKPRTTVVVGPSGVGKSSLINALGMRLGAKSLASLGDSDEETCGNPEEACAGGEHPAEAVLQGNELLAASEVSERSGKGRHTTRNVTLLELANGGGRLVDTPGFSQPSLAKLTGTSVADYFPEITTRLDADESGGCAFADCMHVGEPNCVVGGGWDRYGDYVGFLAEVRKREELQKRVLGTKQESKVRYKTGTMGVLQAEPRLVSSKHRRESRKSLTQSVEGDVWEQRQDQQEVDELSLFS